MSDNRVFAAVDPRSKPASLAQLGVDSLPRRVNGKPVDPDDLRPVFENGMIVAYDFRATTGGRPRGSTLDKRRGQMLEARKFLLGHAVAVTQKALGDRMAERERALIEARAQEQIDQMVVVQRPGPGREAEIEATRNGEKKAIKNIALVTEAALTRYFTGGYWPRFVSEGRLPPRARPVKNVSVSGFR